MTWRARSGPGSFRGARFRIDSNELSGGKKTVTHEYPQRDDGFVEDLGQRTGVFTVNCYVIGDEYIAARDALVAALKKSGPGELILPYEETVRAVAVNYRVSEQREEGGIARFQLDFQESPALPKFPDALPDRMSRIDSRLSTVLDKAKVSIGKNYKVLGEPAKFLRSLSAVVKSAGAAVRTAFAPVTSAITAVTGTVDAATEFTSDLKREIDSLILDADKLVRSPFVAADRFRSLFESLFKSPALPARNITALLEVYNFVASIPSPAPTTVHRTREAANYVAMQSMVRRSALAAAANFAPRGVFESYQEALGVRESITAKLDEQIETADDDSFDALVDLRAELVKSLPGEDNTLARLVNFTPRFTQPSLVLAHRLYGNVDRELDIVARNHIRHPGFVTGGRTLQVLSDA